MNTPPKINIAEDAPEADYATVRRLLQLGLDSEEQNEEDDTPDLARKRAIKAHTGASEYLPPKAAAPAAPPAPTPAGATATPPGPMKVEEGLVTDEEHRGD